MDCAVKSFCDELLSAYESSCGLLDMLEGENLSDMVQIHATLDDVGNPKDGISAVVGYVAYSAEWKKFNWRWMISLQQLNIGHIHTSKYLRNFWLSDHEIRDEDICVILAPFIETVKATLLSGGAVPICVITDHAAYDQLNEQEKKFIRPPAQNSFEIAVALSCRALRSPLHISDSISVQMDESDSAPILYRRWEAMKRENPEFKTHLGAICFCDDEKHPPVQAADLLGNVLLKSFRAWQADGDMPRALREITVAENQSKLILQRYTLDSLRQLAAIRMQRKGRMEIPEK